MAGKRTDANRGSAVVVFFAMDESNKGNPFQVCEILWSGELKSPVNETSHISRRQNARFQHLGFAGERLLLPFQTRSAGPQDECPIALRGPQQHCAPVG